jgi:hypothetical protein
VKIARLHLKSVSPYSQSKALCEPKLERETADAYEARCWRLRIHSNETGEVFIPPMGLKSSIEEAAKYLSLQIPGKGKATYTKHFEAGVLITEPIMLGINAESVPGERLFLPSNGVHGDGKRVWKTYPRIDQWAGVATVYIFDEIVVKDVFERVATAAGQFIGLGRFRPRNRGYYGRFAIEKLEWDV